MTIQQPNPPWPLKASIVFGITFLTLVVVILFALNGEWFRSSDAIGKANQADYSAAGLTVTWSVLVPLIGLAVATFLRIYQRYDYDVHVLLGVVIVLAVLGCCLYAIGNLYYVYGRAPYEIVVTNGAISSHVKRPCDYQLGARVDYVATRIGAFFALLAWLELGVRNFKSGAP